MLVLRPDAITPTDMPIAALIAISRVALRVHHVGDVLGGVVLGSAGAIGAAALFLH